MKASEDLPASRSSVETPRVLVVEDNVTTRKRMARALSSGGYQIEEATDGHEGLAAAARHRFHAIVLDLIMPRMDGWQFREAQLRDADFSHTPTVVVTAIALRDAERYALRGASILLKPFEDAQLVATVDRLVGRAAARGDAPPATTAPPGTLFWSKRGAVACEKHAPVKDLDRWHAEGWQAIPREQGTRQAVYQCERCPGSTGPVRHVR